MDNKKKYIIEEKYWTEKLKNIREQKPLIRECISTENWDFKTYSCEISESNKKRLFTIANNSEQRLLNILIAILQIVVYKLTDDQEVVIATPIFSQDSDENFINTMLVIENELNAEQSFKEILLNARYSLIEAVKYQNYPITRFEKNKNLFRLAIMLDTAQEETYIGDLQPDLLFTFAHKNDSLILNLKYNHFAYPVDKVKELTKYFTKILSQTIYDTNQKLKSISLLSQEEIHRVIHDFNNNSMEYPENKSLKELFEETCIKYGDQLAVCDMTKSMTYDVLNKKANQLARNIMNKLASKCETQSRVAILVNRNSYIPLCILAVLKAGAAYVPISMKLPSERIEYMLKDSKSQLILVEDELISIVDDLKDYNKENIIKINEALYVEDDSNIEINVPSTNLSYIIYTSGTTGQPKGVMIEQQKVINFVYGQKNTIYGEYGTKLNMCLIAPYFFDASVQMIFGSLLFGNCLFIPCEETIYNGKKIISYMNKYHINVSDGTPTFLRVIASDYGKTKFSCCVQRFILGGEYLDKELVNKFFHLIEENVPRLTNVYGPTEATVNATSYDCGLDNIDKFSYIPIGKSIPNYHIYILNKDMQINPTGLQGELYIGGDGLSIGYTQEKENERFIHFDENNGEIIYKTGDQAILHDDGNIEFIGRMDSQVKLRGNRIELSEIDKALTHMVDIVEAITVVKELECNKLLVAYIVADINMVIEKIQDELRRKLPDYMIPSYIVQLDRMPINSNGKIDRSDLEVRELTYTERENYIAPKDEYQKKLLAIWNEVLKPDFKIGITSNFYSCGGDSIKALKILSKSNEQGFNLSIKDIIDNPTIDKLSRCVSITSNKQMQQDVVGNVELTPIQRDFFRRDLPYENHFNNSIMLYRKNGFDINIVRKVMSIMLKHHDILRAKFIKSDNSITEEIVNVDEFQPSIEEIDIKKLSECKKLIEDEVRKQHESMDISKTPLIKLTIFHTDNGDHLLIVAHHLIIDGVSWQILAEDMSTLYTQAIENKKLQLPLKTASYQEWASQIRDIAKSESLLREEKYWEQVNNGITEILPTDYKNDKNFYCDCDVLSFHCTLEETKTLMDKIPTVLNSNINVVLLSTIGMAVKSWFNREKILITVEGNGRIVEGVNLDVSRTVGWFTSLYPIQLNFEDKNDILDVIKATNEVYNSIPNHGAGYNILKQDTIDKTNSEKINYPKAEIIFNYLGDYSNTVKKNDIFELSYIAPGNEISLMNTRDYKFEINSIIINNCLELNLVYNTKEYQQENVEHFLSLIKNNLIQIIQYVNEKQENFTVNKIKSMLDSDLEDANEIANQISNLLDQ